jgi:hypothetical protein
VTAWSIKNSTAWSVKNQAFTAQETCGVAINCLVG